MRSVDYVRRMLGMQPAQPKSRPRAKGAAKDLFSKRDRDAKALALYDTIYQQGGLISEAIDQYPLAILSDGYTLVGDESLFPLVEETFQRIGVEDVMWQGIIEALKSGDGVQEIVPGRGDARDMVAAVVTRASKDFDIDADDYGRITGYKQVVGNLFSREEIPLAPEEVVHLQLFPVAGSVYGSSLIGRALDDINADTMVRDSTVEAIKRHGFRRYHIKVGQPGESVPQEDIDYVSDEFAKLDRKREITTQRDVDIVPLDQGTMDVKNYYEWAVDRICTALGTPEELLGLGRGATEATANVRLKAWQMKVRTLKQRVERAYNHQLVDRITGVPGAVRISFNDPPKDELQVAQYIQALMGVVGDPELIIDAEEAREILGLRPRGGLL